VSSPIDYTKRPKAAKTEKPLENVSPKVGLRVRIQGEPGIWQLVSRTPHGMDWWASPVDEAARNAEAKPPPIGAYRQANYRQMRPHNFKGDF